METKPVEDLSLGENQTRMEYRRRYGTASQWSHNILMIPCYDHWARGRTCPAAQFYVVRRYHTGGRTQSDHRLGVVRIDRVHQADVLQDTRVACDTGLPLGGSACCDQGSRQLAGKSHVTRREYKYSRLL